MLIEELKGWVKLTSGKQKNWFAKQLDDARVVKVSKLRDIFSENEIKRLRSSVKPQIKQCYANATKVMEYLGDTCKYVEGKMTCFGCVGIDHAFNSIERNGKVYYFDITMELALKRDPTSEEYITLGEYGREQVFKVLLERGVYGDVYNFYYQLKQN